MKEPLFFLIILSLGMGKSFAQLNESDTATFQLRANITGNYQQGNVEVLVIKTKIDYSFSPFKDWVFKSQNSSLYQSFYSVEADNDIFSRNYLYYKPKNKIYPFAIGYISTNFRRKIDTRYFAGAGLTWQAIKTKNTVLKVSSNIVYEATSFNASKYNYAVYNGASKIQLWRGTVFFGGWNYLLDRRLRFYYDAYWQPAFDNEKNYRVQIDLGVDFPVWRGLSVNAVYTWSHENVVVEKIKQKDKILTFGLSYQLKIKHD